MNWFRLVNSMLMVMSSARLSVVFLTSLSMIQSLQQVTAQVNDSMCTDSKLKLIFTSKEGDTVPFLCKWLEDKHKGCAEAGTLASHCPKKCNKCGSNSCFARDSNATFILSKKEKSCEWLRKLKTKNILKKCQNKNLANTCRATCNICSPSAEPPYLPSAEPSSVPTSVRTEGTLTVYHNETHGNYCVGYNHLFTPFLIAYPCSDPKVAPFKLQNDKLTAEGGQLKGQCVDFKVQYNFLWPVLKPCNGSDSQKWSLNTTKQLVMDNDSTKCLKYDSTTALLDALTISNCDYGYDPSFSGKY